MLYLDSSAIVKLVVAEAASPALRRHLLGRVELVSSALCRTEVGRAVAPFGAAATDRAGEVLRRVELVRVGDRVLRLAATLEPPELRSLDAIHLATAKLLGQSVREVVTYDARMAAAARALGWRVAAPR